MKFTENTKFRLLGFFMILIGIYMLRFLLDGLLYNHEGIITSFLSAGIINMFVGFGGIIIGFFFFVKGKKFK